MEHTAAGDADTGCNYPVRLLGRTYPSGAAIYASELIFTDDAGTYLTSFAISSRRTSSKATSPPISPRYWGESGVTACD